ncbi:MAG: uL13 family ribosomal protein [Patescibacteria group bacterium]|nr:uL13 family ribosomal protein [Patescibacteria group bacterium]
MKTEAENKIVTIDAAGRAPGRVASEVAVILRDKDSAHFERHILGQTQVEVINAAKLRISNAKAGGKIYISYSGYPGGQKQISQADLLKRFGYGEVLRRAVYGMLPANKLRPRLMKHLTISE